MIRKNLILLSIILSVCVLVYIQETNHAVGQLAVSIPTYQTIDLTGRPNTNDFPYGITCADNTYRYITLFGQGALARINKSTNTVTFFDNNAVASGEDWYSLVTDPNTGKIYVNEKDSGKTLVFNPSDSTFTNIPVVENVAGGLVSYTSSYSADPNKITVNESGAGHGTHNYSFGFGSFGELVFTNNYVWQTLDYNIDFDSFANGLGINDVSFHGIARINPSDNSVTRFSISGASVLRGLSVDVTDSTILWLADNSQDKLYKFNTNSGIVTDTINLPVGSKARGVTNDSSFVYVAENKAGNGVDTAKILKIKKSDSTITEIDTNIIIGNLKSGTFSVLASISNDVLIWTDESNHIGMIQLSNNNIKTSSNTSGVTSTNHFMCVEGETLYFAGHGSTVIGSISLTGDSESSHGDSCAGDCYSPHFGNDENDKEFYNDGLTITAKNFTKIINIQNVLHVLGNETINLPVGFPINFTLKAMDSYPDQIKNCELALGIKRGHFVKQDAEFILGVKRTFDGIVSTYEEGSKEAYRNFNATMENQDKYVFCKFIFTPTHHLKNDMFAIQAVDIHQYDGMYFVNDGIFFRGISEIGTPVFDYMDKQGMVHTLTILDQTLENTSTAIDENNELWHIESNLWFKDFVRPDMKGSLSKYHGYDRDDYWEFKAYKFGQELLATQLWDSSKIQKTIGPSFTYKITNYERGHDPVPNMMKAIGDLALLNEGKR